MQIFNYGSINIDHIYRVPHLVQPGETLASHDYQQMLGGKGANQSIALARAGVSVRHIGRYNAADDTLLTSMRDAGVDTRLLQTIDLPSGHAIIQIDDNAENAIVLYAGANHSFQRNELDALLQDANPGDWLVLQNECSCTAEMIEAAVAKGMKVAFNPAPMNDAVKQLPLEKLAVLFVNQIEVLQLLDADPTESLSRKKLAKALQKRLPDTEVVITLGSKGACHVSEGDTQFVEALSVNAVDTTGAGDTFIGYYIQAISSGRSITDALQFACAAAAICVQHPGASASIPSADKVHAFIGTEK